jgi:hypothetical protein|tara:strand:- start:301 stop:600 length:300 start_codon:yes stop_codon:yes gene_type:complete
MFKKSQDEKVRLHGLESPTFSKRVEAEKETLRLAKLEEEKLKNRPNNELTEKEILIKILDRLEGVSEAMNDLVSIGQREESYKLKQRMDNKGQEDGRYY